MRRRAVLATALAAVALSALVFGTGGYSTATMDRGVAVTVADHDQAVVTLWDPGVGSAGQPPLVVARAGLAGEDPVTREGEPVRVVAVVNRFEDQSITVDASVDASPTGVDVGPFEPVRLAPGAVGALEAPVECGNVSGPAGVTLRVRVVGGQLSGVITYRPTIVCATPNGTSTTASPTDTMAGNTSTT
jgi:hypothetical protein